MKHRTTAFFLAALSIFILMDCANIVAPGGGPRDIYPPLPVKEYPPQRSVNFDGNKIEITFDEYIVIDQLSQEILISPPMQELPVFKLRGKTLIIRFQEELLPNTTYSLFFGDGIQDLREKNPLSGYTYSFSTGPSIDSLSVYGRLLDAFSLKPTEKALVMLYNDMNDTISLDSLPMNVPPLFLTRADDEGYFSIQNLPPDTFLLFALHDQNRNYYYDQVTEGIGFLDSLISPYFANVYPDSIIRDSLLQSIPDSIDSYTLYDSINYLVDSLVDMRSDYGPSYEVLMFRQMDSTQKSLGVRLERKSVILFSFKRPVKSFSAYAINYPQREQWYVQQMDADMDSIRWYLAPLDTDTLELVYQADTLKADTLTLSLLTITELQKRKQRRKKDEEEEQTPRLSVSSNINGSKLRPDDSLKLTFDFPVLDYRHRGGMLIIDEDTLDLPEFRMNRQTLMEAVMPRLFEPEQSVKIMLPDSVFFNLAELTNDTLYFTFKIPALNTLGNFFLKVSTQHQVDQYLLDLLDEKGKIQQRRSIQSDTSLSFLYQKPGTYFLRMIADENRNGKWDPGYYPQKKQAEKVKYFEKPIEVRANWDVEELWELDF